MDSGFFKAPILAEDKEIMEYTAGELMVTTAARMISDGNVVFVGMRLPLLAFLLAKETHAPNAIGLFENGVVRDIPALAPIVTMGDPPNLSHALLCGDMMEVMGYLQKGRVDVGFIGGAQIDRFGNLNTTWIGPEKDRRIRLPGSGGAADIASLSHKLLVIMTHQKRRFVEKVDYVTSPGYGSGSSWRRDIGLVGGGPQAVITTLGVLRFDSVTKEAMLTQVHPSISLDQVKQETGWDLKVASEITCTPEPTTEELNIIRTYDPHGFWTK